MNAIQVSSKNTKRDINYLDESLSELVMNDIDIIKPSFYKYKTETDTYFPEQPSKYRPQFHLGLILEDTPDYLQDNTFSGIDVYALSTLSLAGVKYNRQKIENIESKMSSQPVFDFGRASMNGKIITVSYKNEFVSQLGCGDIPIVNITPCTPGIGYYIRSQTIQGFTLEISNSQPFEFNWVAYAKGKDIPESKEIAPITDEMMSNIKVTDKSKVLHLKLRTHENLMDLK